MGRRVLLHAGAGVGDSIGGIAAVARVHGANPRAHGSVLPHRRGWSVAIGTWIASTNCHPCVCVCVCVYAGVCVCVCTCVCQGEAYFPSHLHLRQLQVSTTIHTIAGTSCMLNTHRWLTTQSSTWLTTHSNPLAHLGSDQRGTPCLTWGCRGPWAL